MDISSIFKSKTRISIFRLYFTNPESEYYLRELERILDIPVSMVRAELIRLKKDGIFLSKKKGNLTYYSLNKTYPLYSEFKSITFKTIGVQGQLKKIVEEEKGVQIAFVYGSFAKNETNAVSDIDLFIVGKIDENNLIKKINKLKKVLGREVNYNLFTMAEFNKEKKEEGGFINLLLKDKIIVLKGTLNV